MYVPTTDVSTSFVSVIWLEISPSKSSTALAPGSENVSPTVRLNGLSPVTVIVGATSSTITVLDTLTVLPPTSVTE